MKEVTKIIPNYDNVWKNVSSESNFTKHVLKVKIWAKTVLMTHEQLDVRSNELQSCDFLVKSDILSFGEFLKITKLILELENEEMNQQSIPFIQNNSRVLYSSLLSVISDNLNKKRKGVCKKRLHQYHLV